MKTLWNPTRLLRTLRWHRRGIAIVALAICLFAGLGIALAPPPTGTPVVVATRSLSPGTLLDASAVRLVLAPADLTPTGALTDLAQAVGARLAIAQAQGEILTGLALTAGDALADAAAGEVLVPFRLADPGVAALLHVGTHITVVASQPDGQSWAVARHVRVAALQSQDGGAMLSAGTDAPIVLVATDATTGQQLAGTHDTNLGVIIEDG